MDVLFRTRYLLSLLFRARAEIEANMPIYGSVFMRPSPAPLQTSLVVQFCATGLWGFLCPCPSSSCLEEKAFGTKGELLFPTLLWKFYFFWRSGESSPFLRMMEPSRWILCFRQNHVILTSEIDVRFFWKTKSSFKSIRILDRHKQI